MNYLSPVPIALAAGPAIPNSAFAQNAIEPTSKIVEIESRIDEALHAFRDLVSTQAVSLGDIGVLADLADAWAEAVAPDFPDAEEVRERLNRYIAHLDSTVTHNFLRMQHAAEVKEAFVEARLDRALSILEDRARAGDWTAEQYFAVVRLFHERAEASVDDPDAESVRARLQEMLDSALGIGAELTEVRRELVRDRLVRKVRQLEGVEAGGECTTVYRVRIAELLKERERLAGQIEDTK